MSEADPVVAAKTGRVGHLLLQRPKALNALNLKMIQVIDRTLEKWASDKSVEAVVITGAGDRAFCAGADVKSVYFAGKAGEVGRDGTLTADLFRAEYTLNYRIATYPKPYVAYMDGVTMGGGVGLAVMGSHRIATEQTVFAMPETAIGLFPDVGGSYFLSRLGPMGTLLALTGRSIDASATVQLGLATHFIPHQAGETLVNDLANDGVDATFNRLATEPPPNAEFDLLRSLAERCFTAESVEAIFQSLQTIESETGDAMAPLAAEMLADLRQRSPTSLKVTLEQLRRGAEMTFADCLVMEYRLIQALLQGNDFYEGIRAVLVDKDRRPKWSPSTLEKVKKSDVERYFSELENRDLKL